MIEAIEKHIFNKLEFEKMPGFSKAILKANILPISSLQSKYDLIPNFH